MTKLNKTFDVAFVMREFAKIAPFILLLCAIGTFVVFGIFQVDYFSEILLVRWDKPLRMAIFMTVVFEASRFALLVASVRNFTDDRKANGWLGLLLSLALVSHDISTAYKIGAMWSETDPALYSNYLVVLVLLGLGLEFSLILTVGKLSAPGKREKGNENRSNGAINGKVKKELADFVVKS